MTRLIAGGLVLALGGCLTDPATDIPETRSEAARFLAQATFGTDETSLQRVMTIGYAAWIDEQFALQPAFTYRAFFERREAAIRTDQPASTWLKAGPEQVMEAFYTRALTDKAQLRARVAFALSEIFVVSYQDTVLAKIAPSMVAGFADTLDTGVSGTYRELLEAVSKSPAMGHYLTFRGNAKELPAVGRYPDENYAREIMQLFSIGLHELNPDGTTKLDSKGQAIETYSRSDIQGLSKVFTGWSNYRSPAFAAVAEAQCFYWMDACHDPEGNYHPMVAYPSYHSTSVKTFLGVTIPAQDPPNPEADMAMALDRLANHPNTAPFISRQLIQRLVSSNPSPEYVGRVASKFTETGGSIKETVKAILLDEEARGPVTLIAPEAGKLREPILRLTAIIRAFKLESHTLSPSQSPLDATGSTRQGYVSVGDTSSTSTSFGQMPFNAPSVFNFFRPGYTPTQSQASARQLVAPEMQLVNEASIPGYVNAVQDLLVNGIGPSSIVDTDGQCGAFTAQVQQYIQALDPKVAANKTLQSTAANCQLETLGQRSIRLQMGEQRALAYDVPTIVQHVADRLQGGSLTGALKQAMTSALSTIDVPAPNDSQTNGDAINSALDKRVWTAILMVAVSPEFLVTK
ncbi:MAG: DUF1800 family protein [Aquabacterium sp.]|nr:DUF1800 family protein [Aquabacterium sp.]